jgi:hypothetical protein
VIPTLLQSARNPEAVPSGFVAKLHRRVGGQLELLPALLHLPAHRGNVTRRDGFSAPDLATWAEGQQPFLVAQFHAHR